MLPRPTANDGLKIALRIVTIIMAVAVLLMAILSIIITILMIAQGNEPESFLGVASAIIAVGILFVVGISWWLMSIHGELARQGDDLWH